MVHKVGYVIIGDNRSNTILARSRRLGDYTILVAKCLAVREAILMAIQRSIQRIIIQRDSQLVVNSTNGKIRVPKDNINLVEDVKCLLNSSLEYCNRIINMDADALAKKARM